MECEKNICCLEVVDEGKKAKNKRARFIPFMPDRGGWYFYGTNELGIIEDNYGQENEELIRYISGNVKETKGEVYERNLVIVTRARLSAYACAPTAEERYYLINGGSGDYPFRCVRAQKKGIIGGVIYFDSPLTAQRAIDEIGVEDIERYYLDIKPKGTKPLTDEQYQAKIDAITKDIKIEKEIGELYWYANNGGRASSANYSHSTADIMRYISGNMKSTEAEVYERSGEIITRAKLWTHACEPTAEERYYIVNDENHKPKCILAQRGVIIGGVIYFDSKDSAQYAIERIEVEDIERFYLHSVPFVDD